MEKPDTQDKELEALIERVLNEIKAEGCICGTGTQMKEVREKLKRRRA